MNYVKCVGLKYEIYGLDWMCGGCVFFIFLFSVCFSEEIVGDYEFVEFFEDEEII